MVVGDVVVVVVGTGRTLYESRFSIDETYGFGKEKSNRTGTRGSGLGTRKNHDLWKRGLVFKFADGILAHIASRIQ